MNRKFLLTFILIAFFVGGYSQKKQQGTTAYAITGVQKGSHTWQEVRLVDVYTGEEIKPVYQSSVEVPVMNARTGKPVVKKEVSSADRPVTTEFRMKADENSPDKIVIIKRINNETITIIRNNDNGSSEVRKHVFVMKNQVQADKPFSTNSAACAYDKKHERLYYTPMGINQLRYIDLKAAAPKIYYFEDEPFGVLAHRHDVPNQVTRMVIASDGNGYALTNNAEHLIRFTTGRKPEITDLGAITDDPANGNNSIRSRGGYGGDIVADDDNNLYLLTARKDVFKISIRDKTAKWLGAIQGLPKGYSTNGAAVEKDNSIIVSSSTTTAGFYKVDFATLQAEKISTSESVYQASDLANGNLLSIKKKEEKAKEETASTNAALTEERELNVKYKMSAYPNPVVKGGVVNLTFNDFPHGRYQVQLMDLNGKLINAENVNVGQRMQPHVVSLPNRLPQGAYMIKVVGEANKDKVLVTEQVVVQ